MKRAFPQKVKPVLPCVTNNSEVTDQSKQALLEGSRRSRTSAAMIGLAAISMGAQGLLMVHQGEEAIAAEPLPSESSAATPSTFEVAALSSGEDAASLAQIPSLAGATLIDHVVQEGETLWQLAQFYKVDAVTVAALNGLPLDPVLRVGQVLKFPVDTRVASSVTPGVVERPTPGYYGLIEKVEIGSSPVSEAPASEAPVSEPASVDAPLKHRQDEALDELRQKREDLRVSLAKMKTTQQESQVLESPINPQSQLNGASLTHRIAPGDTLSAIARAYGISQRKLAQVNGITNPDVIRVDQVLVIPQDETTPSSQQASAANKSLAVPNLVALKPQSAYPEVPIITVDSGSEAPTTTTVGSKFQSSAGSEFQGRLASLPSPPSSSPSGEGVDDSLSPASTGITQNNIQVATAPFVRQQPVEAGESTAQRYDYVENLRLEIVKLREKYRNSSMDSQVSAQLGTRVAAVSLPAGAATSGEASSTRINPEFKPVNPSESLRSQVRKLQTKVQTREVDASVPAASGLTSEASQPQLMAAAPLGSENYEPLLPSSLGKMVSPDLPPLGSVDTYLPGASGKFNGYIWPTRGVLTSGYGWRWGRMHKGIDIAAPTGTPIMAAASGVVITAGWNSGGYGNLVEIQHPDGSVTLYAHNNRILVRQGQQVEQGQQIAEMGSTGYSTGPHCHFEVHLPGHGAVNPMAYLSRPGA